MPRRGINLTEEEWRVVKARAAASGLTVSAYIAKLVAGLQEFTGATAHAPTVEAIKVVPTGPADATGRTPVRTFTPAPKPGKKR